MWAAPEVKLVRVMPNEKEPGHIAITRNFCRAILYGEELISPGVEGMWSLELANAMILSSYRGKTVKVPVNRGEYEELLEELKAKSKPKRVEDKRITDTAYTGRGRK